jgi:translocation and assembly module TamA
LLLTLGGCASLGGAVADGPVAAAASPVGTAIDTPVVRVEVEAPGELKDLLERHLDLSRLARLTRGDAVTDTELSRLIDAAPAQVRDLLQTEGYFSPTLSIVRQAPTAIGQPETVRLRISPGERARVSRVTIEVEGALEREVQAGDAGHAGTLADLRAAWPMPAGSAFRNADWSEAKATPVQTAQRRLCRCRLERHRRRGRPGHARRAPVPGGRQRPAVPQRPIKVEGLTLQQEATVQALAGFKARHAGHRGPAAGLPGTAAEGRPVRKRDRHARRQPRRRRRCDADGAAARAAGAGVHRRCRHQRQHRAARVAGACLPACVRLRRVGQQQVRTGPRAPGLDRRISTHPGERVGRWLLGGALERLVGDDDTVMSQRLRAGRAQDSRQFEQLAFVEVERATRSTVSTDKVSTFATSVNYHVVLRDLDSALLPTQGYTLALQGGVGRSHGNGSPSGFFSRAYGRLTAYRPLGQSWYGQARIELGQVFLPGGVAAPDSQLFRAGGDDSVRGYGYRSLGPEVNGVLGSGSVLMTGSLEVARPFLTSMPSLWGAAFVDIGRAGNDFGSLKPALGYGVGVRWRSPVGPLRVDLAWGQEVRKLRLHFSVGIAF